MSFKMHKNIFSSIKLGRFACFARVLIQNSVSEPKIINYLTSNLLQGKFVCWPKWEQDVTKFQTKRSGNCFVVLTILIWVWVFIYVPQPGRWGSILFLVQIRSVSNFSFPCIIFWTSLLILTKFAKIHCWEEGKSLSDFVDLDLIFKVTVPLWNVQNMASVRYLLNKYMDFDQTCMDSLI